MKKTLPKFLLFAPERDGVTELKKEIESSGVGTVEKTMNLDMAREPITAGQYQGIILNVMNFSPKGVRVIEKLISLNSSLFVIVVARMIDEEAYDKVKDVKNVLVLQRPFREAKIIALFCKKTTTTRDAFRREHWRYPTTQGASIEALSNHKVHWGTVANISRGGAFFEADHDLNIIERELVRLSILLDKISKVHIINAEVAWIAPFDKETKKSGLGLKFVDSKELNDSIYKKLKIALSE